MRDPREMEQRAAVIAEARTWIGTKFHHEANIKGVGVDCGHYVYSVFRAVGLIPELEIPYYPADFLMHRSDEWFLALALEHGVLIDHSISLPGDIAFFRIGRIFSHIGIITEWPWILHASAMERMVLLGRGDQGITAGHPFKVVRYKPWATEEDLGYREVSAAVVKRCLTCEGKR